MIVVTTEGVPGYDVTEYRGLAKGCSVRATHAGDDISARIKNALGGEIHEYTRVMAATREQALDRMIRSAEELGANAIVGMRITATEIEDNVAEFLAYGTAVRVRKRSSQK